MISKTHFLEEWGVLVSKEGHISIQQPLISPLYNGKSITDLLLTILKENQNTYTYLRNFLRQKNISFTTLKRFGVIPKKRKNPKVSIDFISFQKTNNTNISNVLSVIPSTTLLDGRYSNNSWLQETPDAITKLTWGNAFQISHTFANKHSLETGDVIKVSIEKKSLKGPVIILPGQNNETITINYTVTVLLLKVYFQNMAFQQIY